MVSFVLKHEQKHYLNNYWYHNYSGKFSKGANFRIIRKSAVHAKIWIFASLRCAHTFYIPSTCSLLWPWCWKMQGPPCMVTEFALEQHSRSKGARVNRWAWEWLTMSRCAVRRHGQRGMYTWITKIKFSNFFSKPDFHFCENLHHWNSSYTVMCNYVYTCIHVHTWFMVRIFSM